MTDSHRRPSATWSPAERVTEPAPGVFFAEGPASNWIIIRDDTGFILIDTGYPADLDHVLETFEHVRLNPAETKAVLLTHGHVDHTGSAAHFSSAFGTPILTSPEELAHVQGKEKHQVTLGQVLIRAWRPRVLVWMKHAITAGALSAVPAISAEAWTPERLKALPGQPEAISVHGHTPGHASILLPQVQAIVTGDSLITGHPLSRHIGPQLLDPMFHSDPAAVLPAADALDGVEASVILPGHGPALAMPLSEALAVLRS